MRGHGGRGGRAQTVGPGPAPCAPPTGTLSSRLPAVKCVPGNLAPASQGRTQCTHTGESSRTRPALAVRTGRPARQLE